MPNKATCAENIRQGRSVSFKKIAERSESQSESRLQRLSQWIWEKGAGSDNEQ